MLFRVQWPEPRAPGGSSGEGENFGRFFKFWQITRNHSPKKKKIARPFKKQWRLSFELIVNSMSIPRAISHHPNLFRYNPLCFFTRGMCTRAVCVYYVFSSRPLKKILASTSYYRIHHCQRPLHLPFRPLPPPPQQRLPLLPIRLQHPQLPLVQPQRNCRQRKSFWAMI